MQYFEKRKKSSCLILLLIFGISLLISIPIFAKQKVSLQLKWKHQFQFAGYYIAKEMGYYDEVELDVDIREYDFGMNITDKVLSGEVDFGIGLSSIINEKMNGKDIYMILAAYQNSPFVLLTKDRDDIKTVNDFQNKKLMVTKDLKETPELHAMLISNNVHIDDYIQQTPSYNVDDLINEKTDAMAVYVSNEPYQMQKKDVKYKIFSPTEHGYNFYSDILFTSKKLSVENPELIDKFRSASLKGWKYAFENIDETADLIYKKYNTQNKSKEALKFEGEVLKVLAYEEDIPFGDIDINRLNQIAQAYLLLNFSGNHVQFEGCYYKAKNRIILAEDEMSKYTELNVLWNELGLNKEEKQWIMDNSTIRVNSEVDWAPYNFIEGKEHKGYSIEIMSLIAEKLGLNVEYVANESWEQSLKSIKNNEADVIMGIIKTKEREEFLEFTQAYVTISPRIAYLDTKGKFKSIEKLKVKTVATIKDYHSVSLIVEKYPNVKIKLYSTNSEAINAVSKGEADVIAEDYNVLNYLIRKKNINNLTISPELDEVIDLELNLRFAVRKDKKILASIFNKAIMNISSQEYSNEKLKWFEAENKVIAYEESEKGEIWLVAAAILILIFALIGVFLLFRSFSNNFLTHHFGSLKFRIIAISGMTMMIVMVNLLVIYTLDRNKKITLNTVSHELRLIVQNTMENNDLWIHEHLNLLSQLGRDPELVAITKRLLKVEPEKDILLKSQELADVREFMSKREDELGEIGFFIINTNNISIASRRDSNVGSVNLIAQQKPKLLKQTFRGNATFIPPIISDVDIQTKKRNLIDTSGKPLTMFFAAPIRDQGGKVIAVLTQRLLPKEKLTKNMLLGRLGLTGETYFVNSKGQMVTESRFQNQLFDIGLLNAKESRSRVLEIRDPGGNLLKGFKPHLPRDSQQFTEAVSDLIAKSEELESGDVWLDHSEVEVNLDGYRDYRGVPVYGAWIWEKHLELGILTEIDIEEALSGYHTLRFFLLVITGITLLLAIIAVSITLILGERATNVMRQTQNQLKQRVDERTLELKEAQEHVQKLLEAAPDGFLVIDSKNIITLVNAQSEKIFGYTREQMIGQRILKLISDDLCKDDIDNCKDLLARHKSGRLFPIEMNFSPVDTKGETITIAAIRDITKRKNDERELRKLSSAVEESPVVIIITNKKGEIEYVNKYFSTVTGYNREEVIGEKPSILNSGYHPKEFYKEMWTTVISGKSWKGEIYNKKKNGGYFWESTTISPIFDSKREIINFVAIKRDITESKRLEEELIRAKEKAEVATLAKSNFLANMSHEIRTPMNAILGMSHLALKTDLTAKQYDYIDKIDTSAKSLLGIINDILDFSKIEAGKMNIEIIDFDLSRVIANLSTIVTNKAQEKKLELIFAIDPNVPKHLKGDPLRLGQILLNFVNNAIKFTEEGEIVVSIKILERSKKDVLLKFSVRDTGIGLSEQQQDKLFQSFQQADVSTTRKYGGTGLGLAISKRLVEMMNGSIGVKSKLKSGSTFYFDAKFEINEESNNTENFIPETLNGLKVMLVDNNRVFRNVMKEFLIDFGFIVKTYKLGELALEALKKTVSEKHKPFNLVIIDFQINNIETIKAIEEMQNLAIKPKIILTTGFDYENAQKKMEELNLDGLLTKPIIQSQLFDAIMDSFGQNVPRRSRVERDVTYRVDGFSKVRGASILLVEDNVVNQQVALELLEAEGFYITIAGNGQIAIDTLLSMENKNKFDIVLMDLQMPVMDGYTAVKLIRENDEFTKLPIIAMTADAMSGVKEKVAQFGMNDYVTKPISPENLFKTLTKWIEHKKRKLPQKYLELSGKKESKEKEETIELEGFDISSAIERVGGSVKAYKKTLKKVVEAEKDAMERLSISLDKNDRETAIRIAHTLKGVAGNIGANSLYENSLKLERELNDNSDYPSEELLNDVSTALIKTINIIETALDKVTSESIKEIINFDLSSAKQLIGVLNEQIDNFDSFASDTCEELIPKVKGTAFEEKVIELGKALEVYDFDQAEILLKDVVEKIGEYERGIK